MKSLLCFKGRKIKKLKVAEIVESWVSGFYRVGFHSAEPYKKPKRVRKHLSNKKPQQTNELLLYSS